MSLCDLCVQHHHQEAARLKKLMTWGLLGSVGVHLMAYTLSTLDFWPRQLQDEWTPIELIVTEPPPTEELLEEQPLLKEQPLEEPVEDQIEPVPPPDLSAQLSTETLEENTPLAEPQPAPIQPIPIDPASVETTKSLPETQVASDLLTPAPATDDSETGSFGRLAEVLRSRRMQRESQGQPTSETTATGTSNSEPVAATGQPSGATENTPGNGQGTQGAGSRTVACQDCVKPQYPESARRARIEGQPQVNVDINPDGSVRAVTLTRSSGNADIDRAAIEAARQSRFQPVSGGASVPVDYDLNLEGSRQNREVRRRQERLSVEIPAPEPAPAPPPVEAAAPEEPVSNPSPPPEAVAPPPPETSSPPEVQTPLPAEPDYTPPPDPVETYEAVEPLPIETYEPPIETYEPDPLPVEPSPSYEAPPEIFVPEAPPTSDLE
ncbi:TonB family protein [Synechococcales cyanobacterium C]|uniref:TonB family protein n=1 Tax=Petrachloros mirabilis ULC683 TaxID=2781853 RepID=A0A8K2A236_9CYAN|nr:energy transducer TonB [Petrachloros mirabilis]NCJ08427.1 TonB family protein [Petrachloros mirabilis ULC683]